MKVNKYGYVMPVGEHHGKPYYSTHFPEQFLKELVPKERMEPGMVYVKDGRLEDYEPRYAHITEYAQEMSDRYPNGRGPTAFEIIVWKDGSILTVMTNNSMDEIHFSFDFWAGLVLNGGSA